MDADIDYELTHDQWEALKALRAPVTECRALSRPVLAQLIAFGLADISGDLPVISPMGRKVLVRGSSKLLDVAA